MLKLPWTLLPERSILFSSHQWPSFATPKDYCIPTFVLCLLKLVLSVLADQLSKELSLLSSWLAFALLTTYVPSL